MIGRRFAAPGSLIWVLLGMTGPARAEDAVVLLTLDGEWAPEVATGVEEDLRASLGERSVSLTIAESPRAVARIRISAPSPPPSSVTISIEDRLNQKRVEREIALADTPEDVWSVLIAASADELLRAAWLELSMPDAPPPSRPVPPAALAAARDSIARRPGWVGIAIGAGVEGYVGGGVTVGGDAVIAVRLVDPLALEASLVGRALVPQRSQQGRVDGYALGGDLALRVGLLFDPIGIALTFGVRALYVSFLPTASAGALAFAVDGAMVSLRGGVRLELPPQETLRAAIALTAGAPVVAATATDDAGTVLALEGLELGARLEVALWP